MVVLLIPQHFILLCGRIVPLAMDRAIREIITPVVDRSVTIACMTTRELVMKVCPFVCPKSARTTF